MKKLIGAATIAAVCLLVAAPCEAQKVKNGGPNGKLIRGTAVIVAPSSPVTILTTSTSMQTMLVTVCCDFWNGGVTVAGATSGYVAASEGRECTDLGLAPMAQGEAIRIEGSSNGSGTARCSLVAVEAKR